LRLESARGSQIYDWAGTEESVDDLVDTSVKANLRGAADSLYNRRFTRKLADVRLEDVSAAAADLLPRFLDPASTQTAVVCGTGGVGDAAEGFSKWGIDFHVIDDVENSFLSD